MSDDDGSGARGFVSEPDPDNPGWQRWRLADETLYNEAVIGPIIVRAEGKNTVRVRIHSQRHLLNSSLRFHGGATLGLIDISLFAATHMLLGIDTGRSVTIAIDTQFVGAGDADRPLDSVVEILRETGRLVFLRGLVVQDDDIVASFTATTRKPSQRS